MNRMDRLFGLVVLLQHRKRLRAEDLASEFGVSRRTIYRDIYALNAAGVPIVSLPGEGYELMEGYFLPPLVFSVAEASALVLGARLLRNQAAGVTWAGPPAGTCGGGLARGLYETIYSIELASMLGAARPNSFA